MNCENSRQRSALNCSKTLQFLLHFRDILQAREQPRSSVIMRAGTQILVTYEPSTINLFRLRQCR